MCKKIRKEETERDKNEFTQLYSNERARSFIHIWKSSIKITNLLIQFVNEMDTRSYRKE